MQLDDNFLQEVGLATMSAEKKQAFLEYINEELEVRIGERISEGLTETQLNEFDLISEPEEAVRWLERNRPDYRDIVSRTMAEMKAEIQANRDKLLSV